MQRDDLFTSIHKAIRKGLFDVTVQAGATDWDDPAEVRALEERWRPLLAVLESHTHHEDEHILRILDPHDAQATVTASEQHRDLDGLLEHLTIRFDDALATPNPATGLDLYRDLARFVAAYLPHLHEEETQVMPRVWALCTDEELAATRAAFMADLTPEILAVSMSYMLPAIPAPERESLLARIPAGVGVGT